MEVPIGDLSHARRPLMQAHGIRERDLKEIIVADRHSAKNVSEEGSFVWGEFKQRSVMLLAENHHLKRPDRPERHQGEKRFVFAHDPFFLLQFQLQIIAKQAASVLVVIGVERIQFASR